MALPHAQSGEVIDIRPLGPALSQTGTTTLVKTDTLEIIRMVIAPEKFVHTHQVPGEIIVQCLEGRSSFTAGETTQELNAGQMLYLAGNVPHSIHGIEHADVLLTILLRKAGDHYLRHD